MKQCLLLVDWENVWISLQEKYPQALSPQECLSRLAAHARGYGATEMHLFYTSFFGERNKSVAHALRHCGASAVEIPTSRPEPNAADSALLVEGTARLFTRKPHILMIASGDKAYLALARHAEEQGTPLLICGFEHAMARSIRIAALRRPALFLDDILRLRNGTSVSKAQTYQSKRGTRINELARELQVKPSAILDLLPKLSVVGSFTHSSLLPKAIADQVRNVCDDYKCRHTLYCTATRNSG
jgi:hypothetical protein